MRMMKDHADDEDDEDDDEDDDNVEEKRNKQANLSRRFFPPALLFIIRKSLQNDAEACRMMNTVTSLAVDIIIVMGESMTDEGRKSQQRGLRKGRSKRGITRREKEAG